MPEPTTQREAFERHIQATEQRKPFLWSTVFANSIKSDPMPPHLEGHYFMREDQKAWLAWQAARSLPPTDAPRVRELQGWQPIETAPKDGTYVLLCNEHVSGSWVGKFQQFAVSGYRFEDPWRTMMLNHDHMPKATRYRQPTHWQPMPAALARHEGEKE